MTQHVCVAHDTWRQDRADGSILLGSNVPLGPVARTTGEWMHRWAADAPGRVFVAERSGPGWRELAYGELLQQVRQVAASLVARGLNAGTPIAVLSGPGVDHAVLTLAAQYAGIPLVPLAEQYSLVPAAHPRLVHAITTVRPHLVFADRAGPYAAALRLECMAGAELVCSDTEGPGVTPFATLLRGDGAVDLDAVHAATGPDTVAKILFTSGSTSNPKGVVTTQRMMCVNQAQMLAAMPLLRARPQRILDWLPWNHVFGGSHNFNLMLANGGSLYIDHGKPTRAGVADTIRNIHDHAGTLAFNVPVGFSLLVAAMRADATLRRAYFAELELIFYAAAAVTRQIWDELAAMAQAETGRVPLMFAAWGMSETAPAAMQTHQPVERPGNVGVPLPGVTLKLVPDATGRCELRVAGPNVMPGYFEDPEKTREAFDAEGFLLTGDALRFIDPADANAGLAFDGRVAEDFKLSTGTWVRATTLRLAILGRMSDFASDVVLTGHDRDELGLLIFPDTKTLDSMGLGPVEDRGALTASGLHALVRHALADQGTGSSTRIARAMVLADPPSMIAGELTAKGSINARQLLAVREAMVHRLYDDADPCVIRLLLEE
jgi:feruloyl-CoA synthase